MRLRAGAGVVFVTLYCLQAWGQSIISTKSGLITHLEGRVLLAGEPIFITPGKPRELPTGAALSTEAGRAEMLLNPGVFLRMGENSTVRMLSNNLADTRVEFISGAVILEPGGRVHEKENWANSVSIVYKQTIVHLRKNGSYRFDDEPAQLRVYAGEASVTRHGKTDAVRTGEAIALANPGQPQDFDGQTIDSLQIWSKRRTADLSKANESALRQKNSTPGGVWPRATLTSR